MKRLLAQIGITFFSVLAAAFYLPRTGIWILMGAAALTAAVFFSVRKIRKTVYLPFIALTAVVACLVNISYTVLVVDPTVENYEGAHRIEATLKDEPVSYYSDYYYRLRVESVDGEKASFDLLMRYNKLIDAQPFDKLCFEGDLQRTQESYQRSKGYYLSFRAFSLDYEVTQNPSKPLWIYPIKARQYFRAVIQELLPEDDAALCRAILLGDKYALSGDIRSQFRFSGASYFVVVSGMHFSFFTLILVWLLKRTVRNRYVYLPVVIVFTLFYMTVTGFSPSVMRSGIMMFVYLLGELVRRRVYPQNSLGLAGIIMPLILSPYCAGDLGLILSFYATFAILQWGEPIYEKLRIKDREGEKEKRWKKAVNYLLRLFSASLAANILVFPISVFAFRAFSSVTLLSSLLLYFEIEAILLLSLSVCLIWLIPPLRFLSVLLSWVLFFICEAVLTIVSTLSALPFSYVRVSEAFVYIWILMTALLFFLAWLCRSGYKFVGYAALCSLMILLSGMVTTALLKPSVPRLKLYDAGGGVCASLEQDGELYLLSYDAYPSAGYAVMRDIAEDRREAALAVTDTVAQRKLLEKISQREFAISSYLQYDKGEDIVLPDNTASFDGETMLSLGKDTVLTLIPAGQSAARFLSTDKMNVLILPDGCDVSRLSEEYRLADVAVVGREVRSAELLSCEMMAFVCEEPLCYIEAAALGGCYQEAVFICENDYSLDME